MSRLGRYSPEKVQTSKMELEKNVEGPHFMFREANQQKWDLSRVIQRVLGKEQRSLKKVGVG